MNAFVIQTLAWRNIWRSKTRSILTLLAIIFCTGILLFFIALNFSSYETSINASVRLFYGHLQVQKDGYFNKPEMRKSISNPDLLISKIESLPEVEVVGKRAEAFSLISSETRSYGTQVIGVEPLKEPKLSTISSGIREGKYFSSNDAFEAVLGSHLAKNLKVGLGDELAILGQGWDGSLAAAIVTIQGIFESGSNELDRSMIHIPLETFSDIFSMPNQAHSIVIVASSLDAIEILEKDVSKFLTDNIVALRWDELLPGLKESIELDMAWGWLFYFSLVIIVGFSILNTFWMSVLERTKEFGIMLALGTTPSRISTMVILECIIITFIGTLLGVVIGGSIVSYYGEYGFYIPGSEEIMKTWNLPTVIFPKLSLFSLTIVPLTLFAIALIAVFYPALQILKLNPVEAINSR